MAGRRLATAWLLACLAVGPAPAAPATALPDPYPGVGQAYWVELDGRPLWAGAPDQRLPMASLAKLMTALLLAEDGRLDETLAASPAAAAATGTRMGLRAGERFRAGDLFTVMLVRSANDACRALADWAGGGQPAFVARMNARAEALGLADTRFANACGHDAPGAHASVRDLARLARLAMAQPRIREAVALEAIEVRSLDGRRYALNSTNALLAQYPGTRGIKTGYTPGAGRCLVALVERDGHEVLLVLLHAPDRWWDSVAIIELAFDEAGRAAPPR